MVPACGETTMILKAALALEPPRVQSLHDSVTTSDISLSIGEFKNTYISSYGMN